MKKAKVDEDKGRWIKLDGVKWTEMKVDDVNVNEGEWMWMKLNKGKWR